MCQALKDCSVHVFSMTPGPPGPAGTPGLPGLDVSVFICRCLKRNCVCLFTEAELTAVFSSPAARARTGSQVTRGQLDPKETRGKG